jgi:4-hydroxythreonine-4-phosphate dehydrogenase
VNYTAGLPIIRVSPDHGVGYDIVTRNIAHTSSVLASIFLGIKLYYNRKRYFTTTRKNHST